MRGPVVGCCLAGGKVGQEVKEEVRPERQVGGGHDGPHRE